MNQPEIRTERLLLRPFNRGDSSAVQRLAGDKRIADVTANIPHPYPDGFAEQWIDGHAAAWEKREKVSFAIVLLNSEQLVGAVSLVKIKGAWAELGYWVGVEFWGQGYATEACCALVDFARHHHHMKLTTFYACHLTRNLASGKVLKKAGFNYLGCNQRTCGYRENLEPIDEYGI